MTLRVEISAPARLDVLEPVFAVRFETADGFVGVLPGHETARAPLMAGVLEVKMEGAETWFIATEGGLCSLSPTLVRIHTSWAARSSDPSQLVEIVASRRAQRLAIEQEARTLARQRETALQVALSRLRREVHQ